MPLPVWPVPWLRARTHRFVPRIAECPIDRIIRFGLLRIVQRIQIVLALRQA